MPYGPEDYSTVARLLTPTPEDVASAKAWLAERLLTGAAINTEGKSSEFAMDEGTAYPYTQDSFDPADPANQEDLIAYWARVQALRQAIYDFHQSGLIVPVVSGHQRDSPPFFTTQGPKIPLGQAGDRPQATDFPTLPLYTEYMPSPLSDAEREQRLELYDADLYLAKADLSAFDQRARRCVSEALACYRRDLFLAAANMLGAASEAVWYELAEALRNGGHASEPLAEELEKNVPSIARIQRHVIEDLRQLADFTERFDMPRSVLDSLAEVARFWRDLRNFGMHPAGALAPETFSQASIGVQLMGASGYFKKLAALLRGLRSTDHSAAGESSGG